MATEILPTQSDGGLDESVERITPVGGAQTSVYTYTGPTAAIRIKEAALLATATALSGLAGVRVVEDAKGRATLTANYERATPGNGIPGVEESIQELNQIKVVRDIYTAPYFSSLTNEQVLQVRNLYEHRIGGDYNQSTATIIAGWTDLQKALYGHLTHGQESYQSSYYELRQSWKTTSDKLIQKSCKQANTVTDLPPLNATNKKLVRELFWISQPDLAVEPYEWLKEPTQLSYLGRGYWNLTEIWLGAPQWSVVYGGSFTGLEA
ncbi:MAG TPA: hypothetical protein DCY07_05110 [Rhodospirillaceae bacterium]|nr:hypothetical protein [Rhodospirillaceae bacterium]